MKYKDKCDVASGTLVHDPYTGESIQFQRGASKIDIDHVVALSDAWQKGAQQWDKDKRTRFANDPLNLIAVDASANRRKSDGDAATWLPPYKAYRCTYVADQVAVKKKYGVWLTDAEKTAMKTVLGDLPHPAAPGGLSRAGGRDGASDRGSEDRVGATAWTGSSKCEKSSVPGLSPPTVTIFRRYGLPEVATSIV